MAVIYKATNNLTNKAYIGFTKGSAERRFKTHIREGHGLHEAIKEYGVCNFTLEILEESDDWLFLVTEREPHYIAMYNTKEPNGYNRTKGGEYSNLEGIPVDVYDLDLNHIDTVESISECARKYNLSNSMLQRVCAAARLGKASRLGHHSFCYSGDSVKKKVWNTTPGREAAIKANTGRKRPEHSEFMSEFNKQRQDQTIYTFKHQSGKTIIGTRYDLKEADPTVSISELGVLIKGGYKQHRGWSVGK